LHIRTQGGFFQRNFYVIAKIPTFDSDELRFSNSEEIFENFPQKIIKYLPGRIKIFGFPEPPKSAPA